MSELTNTAQERMYTCVSDFGGLEGLSAEEEVPTDSDEVFLEDTSGVRSMLGGDAPQEAERNIQLANNKDEDEEDEVFGSEKENGMESQERRTARMRTRKRMAPGAGKKKPQNFHVEYARRVWDLRGSCVVHVAHGFTMGRQDNVLD